MFLAAESPTHFHLVSPDGRGVLMAKGPLTQAIQEQIRALPKVPGYDDGGTVQGTAWNPSDPAPVNGAASDTSSPVDGAALAVAPPPPDGADQGTAWNPPTSEDLAQPTLPDPNLPGPATGVSQTAPDGSLLPDAANAVVGSYAQRYNQEGGLGGALRGAIAPLFDNGLPATTDVDPASLSNTRPPLPGGNSSTPPPSGPSLSLLGILGAAGAASAGSAPGEIASAARDASAAAGAFGKQQQIGQARIAALEADKAQSIRDFSAQTQSMLAQRAAKADALFEGVANSSIDPHRFWELTTTGQKVAAGVSMLLGGIGAAFTGGQNAGLSVINGAIDHDIQAQRINLDKQTNLLSYYQAQTKDLVSSAMLAKADLLDVSAGQIASSAAQTLSAQAMSQAQMQVAKIRSEAAVARQEATVRGQQIAQYQYQRAFLLSQMAGAGNAATRIPSSNVAMTLEDGSKRQVNWTGPDGRPYTAVGRSEKSAEEATATLGMITNADTILRKLQYLSTQVVQGVLPASAARAKWDALQGTLSEMAPSILADMKRLNPAEYTIGSSQSGDSIIRSWYNNGAALETTAQLLQDRRQTVLQGQGVDVRYIRPPAISFLSPAKINYGGQ